MKRLACVPLSAGLYLALVLPAVGAGANPEEITLKDYKPKSIFQIPETRVERARFSIIDVHSHNYAKTDLDVDLWVRTMDQVGIEKTIIHSGAVGPKFDDVVKKYGRHAGRFEVWCGISFEDWEKEDWAARAMAELERCARAGASGVGELSDKGRGMGATADRLGIHVDDPRMGPILERCGQLKLPINIHVGEDKWMYEPMDASNDGLMNAWKWRITNAPGVLQHDEVVDTLERAVKRHPQTLFIACHLANCCSDLNRFGKMLDSCPNLYGDIGARFAELSPIPRTVARFFAQYRDRLFYGTDMDPDPEMYRVTFRLLETSDEHFYPAYFRKYHWPMHAFGLPADILKPLYRDNALRVLIRK